MNPSLLQPQNTAEELLLLMLQFQRKLIRPSEHLHRDSLSPIQFQALGTLSQFGPQSMSELAAVLMISKQQLTPVVDKLDRMGLVIRTGDALDRRVIRLGLSPAGYDFLNNMKNDFVEMVERKLEPLDEESRRTLQEALHTVGSILEKLP